MNNPWFQLVASLISMIMIANLQYAWTLFVKPIQGATGWTLPDVQWAFSLFILMQTWVQPADGWFIDRIGPRKFITAAGILCGVGWSALAYATTLPQLYFFYALAGIGAAFVYSGSIGSALKWFPTRRGMASGIIAAGFGGGTALFIPIIRYLISTHSYRDAFLITGIFQGLVIMITAQVLRHPGRDFAPPKPAPGTATKSSTRRNTEPFTTSEMLRTPMFYYLYVMFVAIATGGLVVTAQASALVDSWGLAAVALAAATTLSPVANGASRVSWGWISDRLGRENTMAIAFAVNCLSLLAVLTLGKTSPTLFTITLVLTFFTWGEVYSLFPATIGDYFGSRYATSNYGVVYTAKGVAAILAGYGAAKLWEVLGTWDAVFYTCAFLSFIAAVGAIVLRAVPLPKKSTALEQTVMAKAAR
jgi:OFA family oxalate/formate antiporter-like MFS transporter